MRQKARPVGYIHRLDHFKRTGHLRFVEKKKRKKKKKRTNLGSVLLVMLCLLQNFFLLPANFSKDYQSLSVKIDWCKTQ